MRRLMIIEKSSRLYRGAGPDGRVAWRQQEALSLHGAFVDPNEIDYRIGTPIEVRRGGRVLFFSRIISVMYCSRLSTPPQQGYLGLPDVPTEPIEPGDEVWIGERTQAELHRAFVDWSVPANREPIDDAALNRLDDALETKTPHAYRRFMNRYGAGEYNVMPLDDTIWYCDFEAHGDAPLIFLSPGAAIETTRLYWMHGMPRDMIALFTSGGIGGGRRFLIGMPLAEERADDLPVISFEWPYLYPTWMRPYAFSFDGLLSGVLDASFVPKLPFTYDRTYYYTDANRLEIGREAVVSLGPDSKMFRYWIKLPPGRRFRFHLTCDEPKFTVWMLVRRPNSSMPDLTNWSEDKKGWSDYRDTIDFDTAEGGYFDIDGGAFHGKRTDAQPACVVRLVLSEMLDAEAT